MAISPMQFQVLSPQQANPFGFGMQQGSQTMGQMLANALTKAKLPYAAPMAAAQLQTQNINNGINQNTLNFAPQLSQQELQGKALSNALQQNTLNYAPQTSQANINNLNSQSGYYGAGAQKNIADANLTNMQRKLYLLQVADPVTKMLIAHSIMQSGGYLGSNGSQGVSQPPGNPMQQQTAQPPVPQQQMPMQASQAPAAPGNVSPTNFGQQPLNMPMPAANQPVSFNPNVSLPSVAGSANMPGGSSLYNLALNNQLTTIGRNPSTGTSRGGGGATYTDPTTGRIYSTDTTKNTSTDQATIAAIQRSKPLLDSLVNNLTPFQTASGQTALKAGSLLNFLSPNYAKLIAPDSSALPGQYAVGQQALKIAPESLLKGWGLNVTNESLERVEDAIEPHFGETGDQYKNRINSFMTEMADNAQQAKGRLAAGTTLNQSPTANNSINSSIPSTTNTIRKLDQSALTPSAMAATAKKYRITIAQVQQILKQHGAI